jgi:hypothetical protein
MSHHKQGIGPYFTSEYGPMSGSGIPKGKKVMKKALFALALSALALGSASAKSYNVKLFRPAVVAGAELKPGEYTLDISDNKIVLKGVSVNTELNAVVETAADKFANTAVRYEERDGKSYVQEIRIGGTDKKVVLGGTLAAAPLPR